MGSQAYISCPITVDDKIFEKMRAHILARTDICSISYWKRGMAYSKGLLENAQSIVIVHPYNQFKFNVNSLPIGVERELNTAITLGKKVLLLYKTSDDNYNVYDCEVIVKDDKAFYLNGIPGTANDIVKLLTPIQEVKELEKEAWGYYDVETPKPSVSLWDEYVRVAEEIQAKKELIEVKPISTLKSSVSYCNDIRLTLLI